MTGEITNNTNRENTTDFLAVGIDTSVHVYTQHVIFKEYQKRRKGKEENSCKDS